MRREPVSKRRLLHRRKTLQIRRRRLLHGSLQMQPRVRRIQLQYPYVCIFIHYLFSTKIVRVAQTINFAQNNNNVERICRNLSAET